MEKNRTGKRPQDSCEHPSPWRTAGNEWFHIDRIHVYVIVILLLSFAFRVYNADGAFGGKHGWNEAHYAIMARNFFNGPIENLIAPVDWTGGKCYWVPPFYSFLVYLSFNVLGVTELSARMVPLIFGTTALWFIYLLGSELYGRKVGVLSTAFVAFNPVFAFYSRNNQTDAVLLCFMLSSFYFYLKSLDGDRQFQNLSIAGLLAGLGFFTKQPGILIIGIVFLCEILYNRTLTRRSLKRVSFYSLLTLSICLPWIAYNLSRDSVRFINMFDGNAMREGLFTLSELVFFFLDDFNPLMWLLIIPGMIKALRIRRFPDLAMLSWIGVYTLFIIIAHPHEYYSLPLIPPVLILCARFITQFVKPDKGKLREIIFVYTIAILVISSLVISHDILSWEKYGHEGYKRMGVYVGPDAGVKNIVIFRPGVEWSPLLVLPPESYYLDYSSFLGSEKSIDIMKEINPDHPLYVIAPYELDPDWDLSEEKQPSEKTIQRDIYGLYSKESEKPVWTIYSFDRIEYFNYEILEKSVGNRTINVTI